jgi:hypothetical protein
MARKRTMKKIEPAMLTFKYNLTNSGDDSYTADTVDLSQCASAVNRRFYRQGLNWAVAGFSVLTKSTGQITIQKLPDTWQMTNAWQKAMSHWLRQQNEAVEEGGSESAVARFRDFKILADSIQHSNATFGPDGIVSLNNLLPLDISGTEVMEGEWEMSQIVIPNFSGPGLNYEPYLHMVGDDIGGVSGSKALIKGYENSRAFPQSPDPVSPSLGSADNWLRAMFDVGDNSDLVVQNATDKNDNLPYDQDNYPGGDTNMPYMQINDEAFITTSTIGGKTNLKGGTFPCGLVRIRNKSNDKETGWTETPQLLIHLVPGPHRGYMCEPMQEM